MRCENAVNNVSARPVRKGRIQSKRRKLRNCFPPVFRFLQSLAIKWRFSVGTAIDKQTKSQLLIRENGVKLNSVKKLCISLALLFSLEATFAFSDVSALMNFYMARTDYIDVNRILHREKTAPSARLPMNLAFSNYNLLFLKHHLGFFEHLNLHFADDFSMEFHIGPAVGVQLSPRLSIQGGPAFHFIIGFTDNDVNNLSSWGRLFQNAVNFQMGISNDIQLKINIVRFFNVVVGFSLAIDFARIEELKLDGKYFSQLTSDFKAFSLSPYLGVNFSF